MSIESVMPSNHLSVLCHPSNILATWWEEPTHRKRSWWWERLKAGGEGDNRGWDVWMASSTQWAWVWVNSGSWWWRGSPGMLQSMELQRVGHDWMTELTDWWAPFSDSKQDTEGRTNVFLAYNSQVTMAAQFTRKKTLKFRALASILFPFWLQHAAANTMHSTALPDHWGWQENLSKSAHSI